MLLCWIEAHPGLASWVQAMGSLLALAIALLIPTITQWTADEATRRRTRTDIANTIEMCVGFSKAFLISISEDLTECNDDTFPNGIWEKGKGALARAENLASSLGSDAVQDLYLFIMQYDHVCRITTLYRSTFEAGNLDKYVELVSRIVKDLDVQADAVRARVHRASLASLLRAPKRKMEAS